MSHRVCRWGVLGAANIAQKNWQAIRDAGNATIAAVASRDAARNANFIAECQACAPFPTTPQALTSYEALLADPSIDAVYIPLPTGLRKEWVIRAAQAGKHVLCEKPVGRSTSDVQEILAACEQNQVQFMDGVMFMHSARLSRLRQLLDAGQAVGDIRRITSDFSFLGDEEFLRTNIRTNGDLEPLGSLGDLGWYCIRFSLWALGYAMPLQATGRILNEVTQVNAQRPAPVAFSGELFFAGGVSAAFHCSFIAEKAQWAIIHGSRGYLHVSDFVLPYSGSSTRFSLTQSVFETKACQFDMHEGRTDEQLPEPSSNARGSQESRMFQTFSDLVLSGKRDGHWPDISLKTQQVVDACLKSAQQGGNPIDL